MKKYYIIFVSVILCLGICGCSISIPPTIPEEGVWYCEELKMSIDFSMIEKNDIDCVKKYAEDGTYTILRCYIDYGNGMYICTSDQDTWYYYGNFKYKKDTFIYKTFEGDEYCFTRIDDTTEEDFILE